MSTKIAKTEGQTAEYIYLRALADNLDKVWTATNGHSPRTIASVRRTLNRRWDEAVTFLIERGSKPGTINAARVRLEKGKNLLPYLDG